MKRIASIAIACLTFVALSCGAVKQQQRTLVITWTSDGNPGVPVCSAQQANCVAAIQIEDLSTGVVVNVPATAVSYTAPSTTDKYQVRVTGFDGGGRAIYSIYAPVSKGK